MAVNIKEAVKNAISHIMKKRKFALGYPVSHALRLTGFYKWLVETGLDTCTMDNAGDPFVQQDPHLLNAMKAERKVIEFFAPKYGFEKDNFWGLVTFSGTDGNNHGIYFGSKYLEKKTGMKPIVYVSKEAHYSNARLCDLQNLDLRLIDADVKGVMLPEALDAAIDPTRPVLVVYAMGTTFKGGIDDIKNLNKVIEKKNPPAYYRHVDGALFGGYLPFTDMKELVDRRVQNFDSIAVSGHKFLGIDEPCGLFLTTREVFENQARFNIPYLNADMPMINCSRSAIAPMKFMWLIQHDGEKMWTEEANRILSLADWFYKELSKAGYPCWLGKYSNTVYFKRPPQEIVDKFGMATDHDDRLGGDLAHIIVMQHVEKDKLETLIADLKKTK